MYIYIYISLYLGCLAHVKPIFQLCAKIKQISTNTFFSVNDGKSFTSYTVLITFLLQKLSKVVGALGRAGVRVLFHAEVVFQQKPDPVQILLRPGVGELVKETHPIQQPAILKTVVSFVLTEMNIKCSKAMLGPWTNNYMKISYKYLKSVV